MKIIPTISIHTKGGLYPPGSEVSLPDAEAQQLINRDLAIPAPKASPKPPKAAQSADPEGEAGE